MHQIWTEVADKVQDFKRGSKKARDDGDFALALGFLDRAISSLLHLLNPSLSSSAKADSVERNVAEQLADCYGMKGGIFRHARNFDASVACYDIGYLYESCPRFEIVNSYNLLNRLLSRLMLEPQALNDELREVAGLRLRPELEDALKVIKEQTSKPPRDDDPWAWGDRAVCTALLLRSPDEKTWDEFFGLVPSNHAHKTTADTLETLVQCDPSNSLPQHAITAAVTRLRQKQAPGINIRPRPLEVREIARIYNFPTQFDGSGQTIGVLEFGGGYRPAELAAYFSAAGLPMPQVIDVSVRGATNNPGDPTDGQATLGIETIGAIAPKANIRVYFSPFTEQGFVDALNKAVADGVSVISIGWGQPESQWTETEVRAIDAALRTAAERGVTVIAAVGDRGVTDGVNDGEPHVDFPASSPWVLAVGGSKFVTSEHQIVSETVWNDEGRGATGGGVSELFAPPDWQAGVAPAPLRKDAKYGRAIPDVAAVAAPSSGAIIPLDRIRVAIGGTSVSAPLWAGLIALINQGLGRNVGYFNPLLYQEAGPAGVLQNITKGDNSIGNVKGFSAGPGWNAVAGWGSPNGTKLLEWLRKRQ